MQFNFTYHGSSSVVSQANETQLSFAPDINRPPTYFVGELQKNIEFREAISALHDVVVSDLRYRPKDKTAYKEWAAQKEIIDWQQVQTESVAVKQRIDQIKQQLQTIQNEQARRHGPFNKAQQAFFQYVYEKERDVWFVLDPVITVHPDEVFFECFSEDEASYGRLGVGYEVFKNIQDFACGTTNIDYSAQLYNEFQKIRSYKTTRLTVDPQGFNVQTTSITGNEDYRELKIDLPDSWVRGFLQVSCAMALPAIRFELHPLDLYNVCFVLRRHKEKFGPRGLRYHLNPGQPVRIVLEPWETSIVCPRSIYHGPVAETVRVWGRRRLHILERLIPTAQKFTVHLLGDGMPSFYVADLGDLSFTLGLSGWTANDWSRVSNFDLLTPRADVDPLTRRQVFDTLKADWLMSTEALATKLRLERKIVMASLGAYIQAGRVVYDLNKDVYRLRELSHKPLPMETLRFANPREESAARFLQQASAVRLLSSQTTDNGSVVLRGQVQDGKKSYDVLLTLDRDTRILSADCGCSWHIQHKLYQGPCEHILAISLYQRQLARSARQTA
jgi:hypothetical protein